MSKRTFTNKAAGPRSINTKSGYVTLAPGESRDDLEVSDEDAAAIKAAGVLDPANADPAGPRAIPGYPNLTLPEARAAEQALDEQVSETEAKPLGKQNKDELLANPAFEGVETIKVDDKDVKLADATKAQLVAAIEATPPKSAEQQ